MFCSEYVFLSPCLSVAPHNTLKIIDTHDMFSRKGEQVASFGITDDLACTPDEERKYLLKADVIMAIQSREATLMAELVPERKVITVGIDFTVDTTVNTSLMVPGRILVVGSDNPLNIHGLQNFLRHTWPSILETCPSATLRVIGKVGTALALENERIEVLGWVEDIDAEYHAANLVVNPTISGTGLKIKSVEALCHGCALIAWPNGVEALDFVGKPPFVVCTSWDSLATEVTRLMNDPDERLQLQHRALDHARRAFTREQTYAPLMILL